MKHKFRIQDSSVYKAFNPTPFFNLVGTKQIVDGLDYSKIHNICYFFDYENYDGV